MEGHRCPFLLVTICKGCRLVLSVHDDVLMAIIAELDDETFGHCRRVQSLALSLGREMGLTSKELNQLGLGALLHDIGKKFVPERILKKETPLTEEEWAIIKMHPKFGCDYAEALGLSVVEKRIIMGHHLWANGQGGYPENGYTRPCLLTQITTVADVVDAMTSHRPYRQALSVSACLEYLEEHAGTRFNKEVVNVFTQQVNQESLKSG